MSFEFEMCTPEELCAAMGVTTSHLYELRDKLREWLAMQPHLPKDVPDRRLENIIRLSKMSLEEAKVRLDLQYTIRSLMPEFFADRDPLSPSLTELHKRVQWVCLPKLTPEKYRIAIMRLMDVETIPMDMCEFFKYTLMVGELRYMEEMSLGEVFIYDLSKIRLSHLTQITPSILKKSEFAASKAYGAWIKQIHFINAPNFIDRIMTILKGALKPKLAERIHVHTNGYESLYELVPRTLLPKDYGGDQMSMDELTAVWRKKLADQRDWFIEQQNVVVNEALRPTPLADVDQLFGIPGSFRKLEVD